ncbi:MAG: hypothetical protein L0G99_17140 [Propionibacteriales bacterium]|nr:hypothetical protein [Propionibacteriales bacterium]
MTFRPIMRALVLAALAPLLLVGCASTEKPEAGELNAALVKLYTSDEAKLDPVMAQKLADCVTPKFLEQLDASTLNAIVEGKDRGGKQEDEAKIAQISESCTGALT